MKKILAPAFVVLLAIALVFSLFTFFGTNNASGTAPDTTPGEVGTISVAYDRDDRDAGWSDSDVSSLALKGNAITMEGSGATSDGTIITITSAGTYSISGTLDDGQIIFDTDDKETVKLVLNGAAISCSTSAPISVISAEKTVITLADGTENTVTDGSVYIFEDAESEESNAAVFSKDAVAIRDGAITIEAGGDGIQSTNDEDAEKGYVAIEGGTITITAGTDGIQAETGVLISGGTIAISSGGGSTNSSSRTTPGRWDGGTTADEGDTSGSAKGINVAGGNDGSSTNARPGQNTFEASGTYHLYINGGYVVIDATATASMQKTVPSI